MVEKLANQKNFKPASDLPGCVDDARNFLHFVIHNLCPDVKNGVHLLCMAKNVNKICRKIKLNFDGAEETKEDLVEETKEDYIYFLDAEDETQRMAWKHKPKHKLRRNERSGR